MLGAEPHFLGDGIRRAYEARVSTPPQYGFSQDALISRRQILQAACETLADPNSRREYNQDDYVIKEVPWDKVILKFHFFFFMFYLVSEIMYVVNENENFFVGPGSFVFVARSRGDRGGASHWRRFAQRGIA